MIWDFIIPFIAIAFAELGDKSQLIIMFLASKTRKWFMVLLGAMIAFFIIDGAAILFGRYMSHLVPYYILSTIAGIIFIAFGIFMLVRKVRKYKKMSLRNPLISTFGFVFLAELGDKTQITSGLFAMVYNPWMVFVGVMLALLLLSLVAVYVGAFISEKVNRRALSIISGLAFILIGLSMIKI